MFDTIKRMMTSQREPTSRTVQATVMPPVLKAALEKWANARGLTPSAADRMILTERLTADGFLTEPSQTD